MILSIKNMVCDRCVMSVRATLDAMGLDVKSVGIGNAEIASELTSQQLDDLDSRLRATGFQLLRNHDDALVERIKTTAIYLARHAVDKQTKLSEQLSSALTTDYKQLSTIFSAHEHRTIEKFYIAQKIEYVKELLDYGELTVSEIAWRTGYSSVAHLSRQFLQVTGITPTQYKTQQSPPRRALDNI